MSRDAPVAVLQAAFNSIVGGLQEKQKGTEPQQEFIASSKFTGAKPGFYFSLGSKGVGYYADPKQPKVAEQQVEEPVKKQAVQIDPEQLLREAEEQAEEAGNDQALLDARGLKRLVLSFDKKYKENLEARMKHSDDPEKFMASELDLDEEVHRLQAIAGYPELYPELVRLGAIPSILALLSHDNGDIAASVIELLRELTDSDAIEDSEEDARELVDAMVENSALESLVQRLSSFNESVDEEATAVTNTLSIFENMIELTPGVAGELVKRTKVLKWMLNRLKPREFDPNKGSVGEVLAVLLQSSQENAQRLTDLNGIDALLQAIAPYKNKLPSSDDETEYVENLFNALCATLMTPKNRQVFVDAEGVELMVLILKQKKAVRASALKALDFACTRCPAACERFVDVLGLKTLFSIFMGKSKVKRRKGEDSHEAEEEERVVSIISSLLNNLARGSRRDRVCAKFVENEFEKCDHIMELYTRYDGRVRAEEERLADMPEEDLEDMDEDYMLVARMEAGLFTLQQCSLIMGHLWFYGDISLRKRILLLLHQQGLTLEGVRRKLKEFHDAIGDEGGAEEAERQRGKVMRLLLELGYKEEAPPLPLPTTEGGPEGPAANGRPGVAEDEEADPFNLDALADTAAPPLPAEARQPDTSASTIHAENGGASKRAAEGEEEREKEQRRHRDRDDKHRERHKEKREHRDKERERGRDREADRDRRERHREKRGHDSEDERDDRKRDRHR
ncbi:beta-catenin-like protein 1 [Coccomyxa sp. Obi]|nr:beta-catenin-like protein 1 [Coccomyxa sp. Obi]